MNSQVVVLDGSGKPDLKIDGTCELSKTCDGQCAVIVKINDTPVYTGELEFIASDEIQVVNTFGKMIPGDIIIDPVPSNYGKITWNGTTLTVS